ncbi:MAG: DUF2258 domain-containing protein [Crenarchaeota archaeon]|nr:DUF2258 domain-containing protein [Thermoproteota archaeon]MCR8453915.1 DUF2258 domain-containing protein [Thermoproteota archaeon]MCR8455258.1 DUF2258 domain-containing protein [Thermoproteota archaeon]MCR8463058.1 DUF2258 domain-containing protein [Thermoproteota archaeon]MCR8470636.1 DUF2258 domain-containing protein [Thermoproteota archaeon]
MSIRLSTGLVRAAGYADKLRKILIVATRDKVPPREAVRVAAHINQHLFRVFQENRIDKSDVVRIFLNVDVVDDKIVVDWKSLTIEVYKPVTELKEKIVAAPAALPEVTKEEVEAALKEAEKPEVEGGEFVERVEAKPAEIPEEKAAPVTEVGETKVEAIPTREVEGAERKAPEVGIIQKIRRAFRRLFKR